jgi:hypothetical protein
MPNNFNFFEERIILIIHYEFPPLSMCVPLEATEHGGGGGE